MAKIKLSAIGITNISGKSGGSVFAHNKNGNYVRRLGIPTQPQTDKQTIVRNLFGAVARMWSTLTASQRDEWKQWGLEHPKTDQFGDSRPMSGRQAFISVNSNLRTIGAGTITVPSLVPAEFPTVLNFGGAVTFATSGAVATAVVDAGLLVPDNTVQFVLSVALTSLGADFGTAKNKFRQVATGLVSTIDTLDIASELNAIGARENNNIYLKIEFVGGNGLRSSEVTALMVVG